MLLHSFLWPGLTERAERLDAAIATFLESARAADSAPRGLRRGSSGRPRAALAGRAHGRLPDGVDGLPAAERYALLLGVLEAAAADGRPLAWVSTRRREETESGDRDSWELELRLWPGQARLVALVDFHGNWIDWLDLP